MSRTGQKPNRKMRCRKKSFSLFHTPVKGKQKNTSKGKPHARILPEKRLYPEPREFPQKCMCPITVCPDSLYTLSRFWSLYCLSQKISLCCCLKRTNTNQQNCHKNEGFAGERRLKVCEAKMSQNPKSITLPTQKK